MPNPIRTAARGLMTVIGAGGSLFVKQGVDGKINFALAPLSVVLVLVTGVTCGVQKTEPFSVCVRNTIQSFGELVNAH